jgi:hypothetical protein
MLPEVNIAECLNKQRLMAALARLRVAALRRPLKSH